MMLRVMCQKLTATRSGPRYSNLWSGRSFEVITAFTPFSFSALDVSIERIRACACGERRILPQSMPGREKSAPYCARPVTFGTPSGRTGLWPTTLSSFSGWGITLAMSASAHFSGGVEHRLDDLVVTGAAAEVARQPVAHLFFSRIVVAFQQRLRRDQHARRADAALERGVLEELALERVQLVAVGHALDRLNRLAVQLGAKHQARAHQPAVHRHAARAAIAGRAAFLGAGQVQLVAQDLEQRLARLAQKLDVVAVQLRLYVYFGHQFAPRARLSAISAARRAITPATLIRYSFVPRLSSIGRHAALAAAAIFLSASSSTFVPISAAAASLTSNARSATAPRLTRASLQTPLPSSTRLMPAPTTAMSISVRGMKRR